MGHRSSDVSQFGLSTRDYRIVRCGDKEDPLTLGQFTYQLMQRSILVAEHVQRPVMNCRSSKMRMVEAASE